MRLLDPRFNYIPSTRTDVTATWQRFGFRPTTEAERRARQLGGPPLASKTELGDAGGDIELAHVLPAASLRRAGKPGLIVALGD